MLRMSKLTDYGTLVLAQFAAHDGLTTCAEVARATHLTPATVSKLLKSLVHAGLVISERGVQGGYALVRPPPRSAPRRSSMRSRARSRLPNAARPSAPATCSRSAASGTLGSASTKASAWP